MLLFCENRKPMASVSPKPDLKHLNFQDFPNEVGQLQALLPYSTWEVRAAPIPCTQLCRVTILRYIQLKGTKYAEVMRNVTMTQLDADYAKNWCQRSDVVSEFNPDRFCLADRDSFRTMLHEVNGIGIDLVPTVA